LLFVAGFSSVASKILIVHIENVLRSFWMIEAFVKFGILWLIMSHFNKGESA